MIESESENMSVKVAATYLRVSIYTLYKLAASGEVPAFRIGGQWRFRKSTLDAWIAAQEAQSNATK